LALSIIVFLSSGIRFTIGPFLKPVSADLGLDRGRFPLVIALSRLLYGGFMPLVGRLVARVGSRTVCTAGAVVMAASLVLTDHGVHPMAASSAIGFLGMTAIGGGIMLGYGAAFGVAGSLLQVAAILSLSIDEQARPACRTVPIPSRPHPVAGGR
jgi:MFS family permease